MPKDLKITGVISSFTSVIAFITASVIMTDWRELQEDFMFGINNSFFAMPFILLLYLWLVATILIIVANIGYWLGHVLEIAAVVLLRRR